MKIKKLKEYKLKGKRRISPRNQIIPIPQNNIQYNQLNNIIESYAEKDP